MRVFSLNYFRDKMDVKNLHQLLPKNLLLRLGLTVSNTE